MIGDEEPDSDTQSWLINEWWPEINHAGIYAYLKMNCFHTFHWTWLVVSYVKQIWILSCIELDKIYGLTLIYFWLEFLQHLTISNIPHLIKYNLYILKREF